MNESIELLQIGIFRILDVSELVCRAYQRILRRSTIHVVIFFVIVRVGEDRGVFLDSCCCLLLLLALATHALVTLGDSDLVQLGLDLSSNISIILGRICLLVSRGLFLALFIWKWLGGRSLAVRKVGFGLDLSLTGLIVIKLF